MLLQSTCLWFHGIDRGAIWNVHGVNIVFNRIPVSPRCGMRRDLDTRDVKRSCNAGLCKITGAHLRLNHFTLLLLYTVGYSTGEIYSAGIPDVTICFPILMSKDFNTAFLKYDFLTISSLNYKLKYKSTTYFMKIWETSWPVTRFHPGIIYDVSKIKV